MGLLYKRSISKKEVTSTFVKGEPTNTDSAITIFQGNIQPYKGRIVNNQTEGMIDSGLILVFSEEKLNIPGTGVATKGTYVLYHNNWYECIKELDWDDPDPPFAHLSYFRYVAGWREVEL